MTQTATQLRAEALSPAEPPDLSVPQAPVPESREKAIGWLRVLWAERRILVRAVVASMVLGLLFVSSLANEYQASTRLMPPDNQSSSGMAMFAAMSARAGGLGGVADDLLGVKSSGALFIGILRSSTVEDRLVARFSLKKVYGAALEEDARNKLSANTSIAEDRKSGIITIAVTDTDPRRSAAIAQAYIEELDRLVSELSTSSARRERIFLEERLKAVKNDLDLAAHNFSDFASKNSAIDIPEQGRAMVEAAAILQGQLISAQSELEGLKQLYTDGNIRVRSKEAQVNELKRKLNEIGGGGTEGNASSGSSLYPSIRKLPILGVKYADLYRQSKIEGTVYELLTQQYELAKVQEAKETPSVKILDVAGVPERKSYPPRLRILLLVIFSGFALSALWVCAVKRWEEIPADNSGKLLATDVFQTVDARMPWATPNGSRVQAAAHRVWSRLVRRNGSAEDTESSQK